MEQRRMNALFCILTAPEGMDLVTVCIWWKAEKQKFDCKQLQTPQCSCISIRLYGGSRELSRLNGRTVMHSYRRPEVTSCQCVLLGELHITLQAVCNPESILSANDTHKTKKKTLGKNEELYDTYTVRGI
jgi:hypothetical protein